MIRRSLVRFALALVASTSVASALAPSAASADPPVQRMLTTTRDGSGTGTVTSAPAGISCGATCTHDFDNGTVVTLTANASPGSSFTGWSGGGCHPLPAFPCAPTMD